jgi:SAUR family protein
MIDRILLHGSLYLVSATIPLLVYRFIGGFPLHFQAINTTLQKSSLSNNNSFSFHSPFSASYLVNNHNIITMGIRLPYMVLQAKQIFKSTASTPQLHSGSKQSNNVPKGHIAVYVGELQKKRFVVPISYLNHPTFLDLLNRAQEEFGYNHPMGGLTIPCKEDAFINLTSQLRSL